MISLSISTHYMFLSLWLSVVAVEIFERFMKYLLSSHKPRALDKHLPSITNWTLIMVEVKTASISKKIDAEIGFKISGLRDSLPKIEEELIISMGGMIAQHGISITLEH